MRKVVRPTSAAQNDSHQFAAYDWLIWEPGGMDAHVAAACRSSVEKTFQKAVAKRTFEWRCTRGSHS